MISKKNIWVLTLFSLILVLSVYYITMPNEILNATTQTKVKTTTKEKLENETIAALKLENKEEKQKKMKELQKILSNEDSSKEQKNSAYEELKTLNILKGKEEELQTKIKEKYNLDSFVKINEDKVSVIIISENDIKLASKIMKLVQDSFDDTVFVSVKFEK